jgi:hypothetical protein
VATEYLANLTLQQRHSHIPVYDFKVAPRPNRIPLKSVTDTFSGMSKKSAAHRNGWTWELLRDAAQKPATANLLRKFAKTFSNGALPKNFWFYLASFLMYPFHKKLPEDRILAKPSLRPVTVGFVLSRFGWRVMVKMNMVMVAEQLLLSHQFSFGINGSV